jgi:hypothetical protein
MLVEFGNVAPIHAPNGEPDALPGPAVTYLTIPDTYTFDASPGTDVRDIALHIVQSGGITHLPDLEALMAVIAPGGMWAEHSTEKPAWLWSDNAAMAEVLGAFFDAPQGRPDWLEDGYYTTHGGRLLPPGVIPAAVPPSATMTNTGRNLQMAQMFGGVAGAGTTGAAGTSTGTGTTSMTDSGASWGTTQFVGLGVWCANRYANILSHTATVLTLDRWYDPTNPGGAAGSTPAATSTYVIGPGSPPACFVGLSANATGVGAGDTTLTAEITTVGGGLIRKIAPLAHTSGAATCTLTPVFTANGTDALPVTIAKIGISPSILSTVNDLFLTLLGTTATLSLSGDQLTVTDTVTLGT